MFEGRKICMNIHNLAISFICTGMKQSSLETSICFVIEKKKKKKKKKRKDKIENNNFVRDSSVCEIENGSKNKGKNKFLNWK